MVLQRQMPDSKLVWSVSVSNATCKPRMKSSLRIVITADDRRQMEAEGDYLHVAVTHRITQITARI